MLSGFDRDITKAIADGVEVEVEPGGERPFIRTVIVSAMAASPRRCAHQAGPASVMQITGVGILWLTGYCRAERRTIAEMSLITGRRARIPAGDRSVL
jgi:hypothetical protein